MHCAAWYVFLEWDSFFAQLKTTQMKLQALCIIFIFSLFHSIDSYCQDFRLISFDEKRIVKRSYYPDGRLSSIEIKVVGTRNYEIKIKTFDDYIVKSKFLWLRRESNKKNVSPKMKLEDSALKPTIMRIGYLW